MNATPYGRAALRRTTEKNAFKQALALLKQGEVIALPTDTIYGVGCDCMNEQAIAQLYQIKERPRDKAIPLLLSGERQMLDVTKDVPDSVWEITSLYWPGGLTIVLKAAPHLPPILTAGKDTVAVRLPDNRIVRVLAASLKHPLAVSSANLSGQSECHSAQEVLQQIGDRLPLVLDDGTSPGGEASTVLDLTTTPPRILRPGPITEEMLSPWLR